jgi:hypothetical protein
VANCFEASPGPEDMVSLSEILLLSNWHVSQLVCYGEQGYNTRI